MNKTKIIICICIISMFLLSGTNTFTGTVLEERNASQKSMVLLNQNPDATVQIEYKYYEGVYSVNIKQLTVHNKVESGIFTVKIIADVDFTGGADCRYIISKNEAEENKDIVYPSPHYHEKENWIYESTQKYYSFNLSHATYEKSLGVRANIYQDNTEVANVLESTSWIPSTNRRPRKANLSGPSVGVVGEEYTYTACATDPDGHDIRYVFNWNPGTGCPGRTTTRLVPSGQCISRSKTFTQAGEYYIRARAKDRYGAEGSWSHNKPADPGNDYFIVTITDSNTIISIDIKSFNIRHISVRVTNNVDAIIYNLDYEINIIGNIPRKIDIKNTGTISSLESSSRVSLSTYPISGLGFVDITVFIREEDKTYSKEAKGVVIGSFIIVL